MGITVNLNRRMFRFLIVMNDIKPTIWRSIELDEDTTFWDLHMAIQDVMSWDNAHFTSLSFPIRHMKNTEIYCDGSRGQDLEKGYMNRMSLSLKR